MSLVLRFQSFATKDVALKKKTGGGISSSASIPDPAVHSGVQLFRFTLSL